MPAHAPSRWPKLLLPALLIGLILFGHLGGWIPNGHIDGPCYDPEMPDPQSGTLEMTVLGTAMHHLTRGSSLFETADVNCTHIAPDL
jgi:hypothetical protein